MYSVGKSRQHSYKAEYRDPIRTHPVGLKAMSNQLWESSFTLLCVFWKKWIALNVTILRHHHSEPGSTLWGQAAKVQKLSHFETERWDAFKLCAVSSFRHNSTDFSHVVQNFFFLVQVQLGQRFLFTKNIWKWVRVELSIHHNYEGSLIPYLGWPCSSFVIINGIIKNFVGAVVLWGIMRKMDPNW